MSGKAERCRRCNRPIRATRSVTRQCGPVCWRRTAGTFLSEPIKSEVDGLSSSVYAAERLFKVNREMAGLDERAARAFEAPW